MKKHVHFYFVSFTGLQLRVCFLDKVLSFSLTVFLQNNKYKTLECHVTRFVNKGTSLQKKIVLLRLPSPTSTKENRCHFNLIRSSRFLYTKFLVNKIIVVSLLFRRGNVSLEMLLREAAFVSLLKLKGNLPNAGKGREWSPSLPTGARFSRETFHTEIGEENPGIRRKTPEQEKLNTYEVASTRIEPGSQRWEANAYPLRYPRRNMINR